MSFEQEIMRASQKAVKALGREVTLPDGSKITGIFTNPSEPSQLARGGGASGKTPVAMLLRAPQLVVLVEDADQIKKGARVSIGLESFDCVEPMPDGCGKIRTALVESRPDDGRQRLEGYGSGWK
jgi:hypothetical protein